MRGSGIKQVKLMRIRNARAGNIVLGFVQPALDLKSNFSNSKRRRDHEKLLVEIRRRGDRAVTIWCKRFSVNFGTAPLVQKQS